MAFNILRVPFFLEPDYPTTPEFEETNRVRLIRKWGGEAGSRAQKSRHRLKERGQEVGIEHFNLDRVASNTLASHRVVQWVTRTSGMNKAEQLYAELNRRHFVDGQKLNDTEMLVEAAAAVGADPHAVREVVESGTGMAEIQAAQHKLPARCLGHPDADPWRPTDAPERRARRRPTRRRLPHDRTRGRRAGLPLRRGARHPARSRRRVTRPGSRLLLEARRVLATWRRLEVAPGCQSADGSVAPSARSSAAVERRRRCAHTSSVGCVACGYRARLLEVLR